MISGTTTAYIGNLLEFSTTGGSPTTIDDASFTYTGSGWGHCTSNCAPGVGTSSYDKTTNDYFTVAFNGTQVSLTAVKGTNSGIGAISIDGGAESNVDFPLGPAQPRWRWSTPARR